MNKNLGKAASTREKIVRSAIRVFAKEGFTNTGFKQIGKDCSLSEAAIFYHFKDRDALVGAALNEIVRHNHETVSLDLKISDTARDTLIKHLRGNLKWALSSPDEAQVLVLVYYLGCVNADFSKIYSNLLQVARQRILGHLYAGEREKIFKVGNGAEKIAEALHDLLVGAFVNLSSTRIARGKSISTQALLKHQEEKWNLILTRIQI